MKESMAVSGETATEQFSISLGSDEDLKIYCQSCEQDGHILPAHGYCINCSEHLCETCFTVHRRHKLSRHHILLDKDNMPQTMSPVSQSLTDNLTKPCPKHNIEMIKFYCYDHEAFLCSVCVTLEHTRESCKVEYIPDVSGNVVNSKEYQAMINAINNMTRDADTKLQDMRQKIDRSNKSLTEALMNIKRFRININQRLDEFEKQIEETAKAMQKENNRNMAKLETECGDLAKALKASSDAILHFNTSKQANDLFMELKHAEQMIKGYGQSLNTLSTLDVEEYTFESNEAILNLLDKEKSVGILRGRPLNLYLKTRPISQKDEICVSVSKDDCDCMISGMTLLTPSYLIVTDSNNMAVKMIDINRKSVIVQQELDHFPCDVSSVSDGEIAVTMPDKRAIQFMSVSGNKLKKGDTVKVDGGCYGINCHKDIMVVSFNSPIKVEILLLDGTVLQTIQDMNIFKNPQYITTCDNYFCVSDFKMKAITKFNWQCEVKGKYECKSPPTGLIKTDEGTVFVCFWSGNTIEEITEDFTKGQTVVKDIENPQAVCWSAETGTVYASNTCSDEDEMSFIKLFKFSS